MSKFSNVRRLYLRKYGIPKKSWKKFLSHCVTQSQTLDLFLKTFQKALFTLTKKGQKSLRLWFQNDDLNDFNHFSLANGFFPTEMLAWIVYGTLETEQMNVTSRIFISSVVQEPLKKWTEHSKLTTFPVGANEYVSCFYIRNQAI